MNTRRVEEYLKRLKRRERFLEGRAEGRDYESSHYDRAELTALRWIIRYAEDTILDAADHNTKYSNEMREDE